jgi:hypothetical protein
MAGRNQQILRRRRCPTKQSVVVLSSAPAAAHGLSSGRLVISAIVGALTLLIRAAIPPSCRHAGPGPLFNVGLAYSRSIPLVTSLGLTVEERADVG